tara:strand:+ start:162 stop:290 length:129 start_codon:yes stop_codon:yes gene_type:complete
VFIDTLNKKKKIRPEERLRRYIESKYGKLASVFKKKNVEKKS